MACGEHPVRRITSNINRASSSIEVIVQSSASSRAASASFSAGLPVGRIIVSGFGQFRVARIRNQWPLSLPCALLSHHKSTSSGILFASHHKPNYALKRTVRMLLPSR